MLMLNRKKSAMMEKILKNQLLYRVFLSYFETVNMFWKLIKGSSDLMCFP
jgi:hypothetical protein